MVDDLILAGLFTLKFRCLEFDDFHRHTVIETQTLVGHAVILTLLLTGIGDLFSVGSRMLCGWPLEQLAYIQLIR